VSTRNQRQIWISRDDGLCLLGNITYAQWYGDLEISISSLQCSQGDHPANGLGWNGLNSLDCALDGSGLGVLVSTCVLGWIEWGLWGRWIGLV
jgi:hypothetical protein